MDSDYEQKGLFITQQMRNARDQIVQDYKTIFNYLLTKNEQLMLFVQEQKSQLSSQRQNLLKYTNLIKFLQKINSQYFRDYTKSQTLQLVFQNIRELLLEKIATIQSTMTEQQRTNYSQIQKWNKVLVSQMLKSGSFRNYHSPSLSLLEIDILSIFLWKNYEYYNQKYEACHTDALMTNKIITKIFRIGLVQLSGYQKRFEDMANYLTFDYAEEFQEIISICCLIQVQRRLYYLTRSQYISVQQGSLTNLNASVQSQIKYKFSEIKQQIKHHQSQDKSFKLSFFCPFIDQQIKKVFILFDGLHYVQSNIRIIKLLIIQICIKIQSTDFSIILQLPGIFLEVGQQFFTGISSL